MAGILNVMLASKAAAGGSSVYDGFAATHGMTPTSLGGTTAANVRSGHWARTDITQLKILCPNYYGAAEIAPGANMGITASVEYPAGRLTQILFSASASGTVPNGGTLLSDYLTISIQNGERFWIRLHLTCSSGLVYIASSLIDFNPATDNYMGDATEASATDRTMSGEIPLDQLATYHPAIIAPTTAPSVLIIGDSIDAGTNDMPDVGGDRGIVARTIGSQFAYFNTAIPGDSASSYLSTHTQRLLLSYCTHVFVGFGTNDIIAGDSKATIEGNLTSVYGLCSTKTVFGRTMVPRTTSTDGWVTTVNQTVGDGSGSAAAHEAVRVALNTDLRSTFGPPGGVFDTGAVVETSAKWIANKTIDGIHPAYSGYVDVASSGAINTALIGTPATPATETGSAWGDHGTKITLSTRRRTNDTATPNTIGNPSTTVRGAGSNSSGRKYFEIECLGTQTSNFIIGLMTGATTLAADLDDYMGDIPDSFGIANGAAYAFVSLTIFSPTAVGSLAGLTNAGDVFGMAVDFGNKAAYLHRNGVWFAAAGGAAGIPTSGAAKTGNIVTWTGTPTLYPGITLYGYNFPTVNVAPIRLRTASFLYAPPTGSGNDYTAWG